MFIDLVAHWPPLINPIKLTIIPVPPWTTEPPVAVISNSGIFLAESLTSFTCSFVNKPPIDTIVFISTISPCGVNPTCIGFPCQFIVTSFTSLNAALSTGDVSIAPSKVPISLLTIASKLSFKPLAPLISKPAKLPPCSIQEGIAVSNPPANFNPESTAVKTILEVAPEKSPDLWFIIYSFLRSFFTSSCFCRAGNKDRKLYCLPMFLTWACLSAFCFANKIALDSGLDSNFNLSPIRSMSFCISSPSEFV